MKVRTGFVSNSSSSSFLIPVPGFWKEKKRPQTEAELRLWDAWLNHGALTDVLDKLKIPVKDFLKAIGESPSNVVEITAQEE